MQKTSVKSLAIRKLKVNKPEMVPLACTLLTGSGEKNKLLPGSKSTISFDKIHGK